MPERERWYALSAWQKMIAFGPAGLALAINVMFLGDSSVEGLWVLSHPVTILLAFPGWIILNLLKLAFRFGSLHGDGLDIWSAPLSAAVLFMLVKFPSWRRAS